MIGVIESGNSGNVHRALRFIGQETEIYSGNAIYDAIVLPGIGHFGAFMNSIPAAEIRQHILSGGKTLAICVGMQALYEGSDEAPGVAGLGVIPGTAHRLEGRIPRVGWHSVEPWDEQFYFVHSYSAGADALTYKATLATQFHPEKSGRAGLRLLKDFFDG